MNVNNFEDKFLSGIAFLSGCLPIAVIHGLRVLVVPCYEVAENNPPINIVVIYFSVIFLVITSISAVLFCIALNKRFARASTLVEISDLKRKDLFSSGALSCYVLPFLSLIGNNLQSTVSLFVLILLFLKVFTNNIMFLYTPIIDIMGYKIMEGTLKYTINGQVKEKKCDLMLKSDANLYFTSENNAVMEKLNETTFCVKLINVPE